MGVKGYCRDRVKGITFMKFCYSWKWLMVFLFSLLYKVGALKKSWWAEVNQYFSNVFKLITLEKLQYLPFTLAKARNTFAPCSIILNDH